MRLVHLTMLLALVAVVPACGGGGTAAPTAGGTVLGTVVSRDGSTADLSGVEVLAILDDERTTTDGTGRFQLQVRARERIRLRFEDPESQGGLPAEDTPEGKDPTPDGTDIDGDEVEIEPLDDGETCEVEVEIENGEVVECWVERHRGGEDRKGEARLLPPDCETECKARGEVEIDVEDECVRVEVEVAGLEGPDLLEILLVDDAGAEMTLGTISVKEDGTGHFVMEACAKGGDLPFDVDDVDEKAGAQILLVDAEGTVVLAGALPGDGPQHDDDDHCHGASKLLPPDASPEPDAMAEASVKCAEECCALLIEAWGFATTNVVTVELAPTEGDAITLGEMEVTATGLGRFALDACLDDILARFGDRPEMPPMPGPRMVEERPMAMFVLRIVEDDGTVLLAGDLPTPKDGRCGDDGHHGDPEPPLPPPPPATAMLAPPDGADEADAKGIVLVKCGPECELLLIEVGRFGTSHVADVVVTDAAGNEFVFGEMEIGKEGMGRFAYEACGTEDLPEGTASLADLAGRMISLVEEGTVLLQGKMPADACPEGEDETGEESGT